MPKNISSQALKKMTKIPSIKKHSVYAFGTILLLVNLRLNTDFTNY